MAISNTHIKRVKLGTDEYYISSKYLLDSNDTEHSYEQIKELIDEAAALHTLDVKVVQTLPQASSETTGSIYLVPEAGVQAGTYVEYITVRSGEEGSYTYAWEQIGTTETDLADYSLKTHVHTVTPQSLTLTASASGTAVEASSTGNVLGANAEFTASGTAISTTDTSVVDSWSAAVDNAGILSFSVSSANVLATASVSTQPTITVSNKDQVTAVTGVSVSTQPTITLNGAASVNVAAPTQVTSSQDTSNA